MNPVLTHPRLTGVAERVAYGALTFLLLRLAQRGYISPDMVDYLALGIISGAGSAYAWWLNRPQNIVAAASEVPNPGAPGGKTVVITTPELAADTPAAPTVISSRDHRIVPK